MRLPKPVSDRWNWIEWMEFVWMLVFIAAIILIFVQAANIEPLYVLERK